MNTKDYTITPSGNVMFHSSVINPAKDLPPPPETLGAHMDKWVSGIINDHWLSEGELESTHASEHPGFKRDNKELAGDIKSAIEAAFKAGRESKIIDDPRLPKHYSKSEIKLAIDSAFKKGRGE